MPVCCLNEVEAQDGVSSGRKSALPVLSGGFGYFLWRQKVTEGAKNAIKIYNSERLHLSLGYKTPLAEISY